jgi:hypothetical protein
VALFKWPGYNSRFHSSGRGVEGLFIGNRTGVKDRGPRRQVYLGHVPIVFRESISGFHDFRSCSSPRCQ